MPITREDALARLAGALQHGVDRFTALVPQETGQGTDHLPLHALALEEHEAIEITTTISGPIEKME